MAQKNATPHPAQCLNIDAVADLLGTSTKTIRRMHNAGRLPAPFRLPGSNILKWRAADIVAFLDELAGAAQ